MFNKTKMLEDRVNELEKQLVFTKRQLMEYINQLQSWVSDLNASVNPPTENS